MSQESYVTLNDPGRWNLETMIHQVLLIDGSLLNSCVHAQ